MVWRKLNINSMKYFYFVFLPARKICTFGTAQNQRNQYFSTSRSYSFSFQRCVWFGSLAGHGRCVSCLCPIAYCSCVIWCFPIRLELHINCMSTLSICYVSERIVEDKNKEVDSLIKQWLCLFIFRTIYWEQIFWEMIKWNMIQRRNKKLLLWPWISFELANLWLK